MRRIVVGAVVLAAFTGAGAATGCKGCSEKERTVELEYGSPFYSVQESILASYRKNGYDCSNTQGIRDAFGRTIGTRYTCTKCE